MYAEDRVLVGVINRKRDLGYLLNDHWYRIPQSRLPEGVYADYLAFFLSGSATRGLRGSGIYYFAALNGIELVRRRDILPLEYHHPRANDVYYQCQMREVRPREPLIANPTHRTISFIYTTWDRFIDAKDISDLYSKSAHYVNRVYFAKPRPTSPL